MFTIAFMVLLLLLHIIVTYIIYIVVALALCDWSTKQANRRNVARHFMHVSPGTDPFEMLKDCIMEEIPTLLAEINSHCGRNFDFKTFVQRLSCNIFCSYLCSRKFSYNDKRFQDMVENFDELFWDINQGYAMDFIDWLKIFRLKELDRLRTLAKNIRTFVCDEIVTPHKQNVDYENPKDFVDMLLKRMKFNESSHKTITEITALYELEDFLGGHSAVGNNIMQALTRVAETPCVMKKIQTEIDENIEGDVISIEDRALLPYTDATLYEALRICSSPIVPHVASRDTSINDYSVKKDTVVFINNYELNTSPLYWKDPKKFNPGRFVHDRQFRKPTHFLPFSTGKRSCMGSKMLVNVSFSVLANILHKFNVSLPTDSKSISLFEKHLRVGCLALPVKTFPLVFTRRSEFFFEENQ